MNYNASLLPYDRWLKTFGEIMDVRREIDKDHDFMIENKSSQNYLTGQLLVAMPSMGDERFDKSVILVCAHDENGAMGLVLNRIMEEVDFIDLIEQLDLGVQETAQVSNIKVMKGGPVEEARGFLLHGNDFEQSDTISVDDGYKISGSVDALKNVLTGKGPDRMMFILGYAGWGPGQLDQELSANAWLTTEPDSDLIFQTDPDTMWVEALNKIGIDPLKLSPLAGRA